MYKDPLGNEYTSYDEYVNSPDLDSDLILINLWQGVRTPQNDEEKMWKHELDEIKRRGKVPDIFWFD